MREDEIIKETRRLRDEYAKRLDYDLDSVFEDLQEKQKKSGRKYVSNAKTREDTDEAKKAA